MRLSPSFPWTYICFGFFVNDVIIFQKLIGEGAELSKHCQNSLELQIPPRATRTAFHWCHPSLQLSRLRS